MEQHDLKLLKHNVLERIRDRLLTYAMWPQSPHQSQFRLHVLTK